jgi:hypothetical protein
VSFSGGTVNIGANSLVVGSTFGFYMQTAGGPTWYSRASDNGGDGDHLVTLGTSVNRTLLASSGLLPANVGWNPSEHLLAWEDLPLTGASRGDGDYQDLLVKVSAIPVPEATTLIAGALLLLPFGVSTFRVLRTRK